MVWRKRSIIFSYPSKNLLILKVEGETTLNSQIVLGIHVGHDRSAALLKDGNIIGSIAQERLDQIKHSRSIALPYDAIDSLLNYHEVSINEISCIAISGDAMEPDAILETVKASFYSHYNCAVPVYFVSHHDSHAYAAFYASGFQNALIFIADGGGDYYNNCTEAESLYVGNNTGVFPIQKRFQAPTIRRMSNESNYLLPYMPYTVRTQEISIARKYEQFTYLLGFGWGQAGKTMGLASYGKSLIDFSDLNYTNFNYSLKYADYLDDLFVLQHLSGMNYHDFIQTNSANIARTVQEYTEKAIITLIQNLVNRYNVQYLCLGGGLFLNCLLNHKILEACSLKEIYIFPASGDDGQAIGNAFYAYKKHFPKMSNPQIKLPYLGLSYTNLEIENELKAWDIKYEFINDDNMLADMIAEAIWNNKIIAFHRGRTEIGPRALCHRSILANPVNPKMKDIINNRIKHREVFRPFAPVVTKEMECEIFELKQSSPYMLFAPTVKENYREKLPSITHIDNTARVQSVTSESEPFIHLLLNKFAKISGVPVLLNTSFNVAGQPIVEKPIDAIHTFMNNDMDILVIGNFWVSKPSLK